MAQKGKSKQQQKKRKRRWSFLRDIIEGRRTKLAYTVYVAMLITIAILLTCPPIIARFLIRKAIFLYPTSPAFQHWAKAPVPVTVRFYVFNVTNHNDFVNRGCKPILKLIGPYTYLQYRSKTDLSWNIEEDTVKYKLKKQYMFQRNMSVGNENDYVVVPNIPMFAAARIAQQRGVVDTFAASWFMAMFQDQIFVKKTVGQFLFYSYFDRMIDTMQKASSVDILKEGRFSLFNRLNRTERYEYVVHAGLRNKDKLGQILTWNGSDYLQYWASKECNLVVGKAEGIIYPSPITKDSVVSVYATDICRSSELVFSEEVEFEGILGYRFVVPFKSGAHSSINPKNICYCLTPGNCLGSSLHDISPCYHRAPLVMSYPYFYQADKEHYQRVLGLPPATHINSTFVDFNPMTGGILRMKRAGQINLWIHGLQNIRYLSSIPEMLLPVAIVDEEVTVSENVRKLQYYAIVLPLKICEKLAYLLSVILFIAVIGRNIYRRVRRGFNKISLYFLESSLGDMALSYPIKSIFEPENDPDHIYYITPVMKTAEKVYS